MAEISIIIPVYNSMAAKKNGLVLVLHSIINQNIDKNAIELIFVDNGSSDDTFPFLNKWINDNYCKMANVQLLMNSERMNRSRSRNMGVEKAGSNKILFLDDDTVLLNNNTFCILMEKYYSRQTFFCGAPRYWTRADWDFKSINYCIQKNKNIESFAFLPKGISRETGYRDLLEFSFIGNFGGLLKEDFNKMQGFDEVRFPARQEDVDFMFRMLLNNFTFIKAENDLKLIHLNHPIIADKNQEQLFWFNEFRKKETEEGYYFCMNHLFNVYEDYSGYYPVLKKIE